MTDRGTQCSPFRMAFLSPCKSKESVVIRVVEGPLHNAQDGGIVTENGIITSMAVALMIISLKTSDLCMPTCMIELIDGRPLVTMDLHRLILTARAAAHLSLRNQITHIRTPGTIMVMRGPTRIISIITLGHIACHQLIDLAALLTCIGALNDGSQTGALHIPEY